MANMLDYVDWRGDIPFTQVPLNEVDNLILSQLCYIDFEGIVPHDFKKGIAFSSAAKRYLRAYFWLFLLTLGELLVGFFLLGIRYAFLLALLTAFLDILPVLGVGVILVPFAVFLLAVGQTGRGIGLLILYAVITVVRQVAEPHLVGKSLGLHPILMLLSLYVGLGVFGVAGFLLGPAIALIAKAVFDWACAENKRAEKP